MGKQFSPGGGGGRAGHEFVFYLGPSPLLAALHINSRKEPPPKKMKEEERRYIFHKRTIELAIQKAPQIISLSAGPHFESMTITENDS